MNAVGVDVGGTKIAAGVVSPKGELLNEVIYPTENVREPLLSTIAEAITVVQRDYEIGGVCLAAPGFILASENKIMSAANLEAIEGIPLKEELGRRTGLEVAVENDANAAAWGEFTFGAAADSDDLLLVTVGTGVGGGLVLDGQLYRGAFGVAAEIGHIRIERNGRLCGCGNLGCFEQYGSGSALVRDARAAASADPDSAEALLARAGGHIDMITGPMITEQALAGDAFAVEQLAVLGGWLGEGIATLAAVLDPGVVAIGGGVSAAGDLLLDPARESYRSQLTGRGHRPEADFRLAQLGNKAGLIGAADLARR